MSYSSAALRSRLQDAMSQWTSNSNLDFTYGGIKTTCAPSSGHHCNNQVAWDHQTPATCHFKTNCQPGGYFAMFWISKLTCHYGESLDFNNSFNRCPNSHIAFRTCAHLC